MNQRGAVQQLDRGGRGFRQQRVVVAAGLSHGKAQLGPNAGAPGEHGMPYRTGQLGRAALFLSRRDGRSQRLFDACDGLHSGLRLCLLAGGSTGKV